MEIALWFDNGNLDPLSPPLWHVQNATYTALTDFWHRIVELREHLAELERTGQAFPVGRREERTIFFGSTGSLGIQPEDVVLLYVRPAHELAADGGEEQAQEPAGDRPAPATFDCLMGNCPSVLQLQTAEFVIDVVRRNGIGMMLAQHQAQQAMQEAQARHAIEQGSQRLIGPAGRRLN